MSNIWSTTDLAIALGVNVPDNISVTGIVQFNSKDVQPGDLFIALSGGKGDGHKFVLEACNFGAVCIIISKPIDNIAKDKCILVNDTAEALLKLANYKCQQSVNTKFITVTGSVGKTSTKEIMKRAFSSCHRTFASRKNFNNFLGLLLNLSSIPLDTEYAILELGMSRSGEIRKMVQMLKIDLAVITNIYPAHTEFFNSLEELTDAKCEIFERVVKDGVAVVNADSILLKKQIENIKKLGINKIFTFSGCRDADSRLVSYCYNNKNSSSTITISCGSCIWSFNTKIIGYEHALNITLVLLVSTIYKLDIKRVLAAIADLENQEERGRIHLVNYCGNSLSIINDCYNASPASMKAALKLLGTIKSKRKVAILSDMKELGSNAREYHLDLINDIKNHKIDKVITIGSLMGELYELLPCELRINHYNDVDDLLGHLSLLLYDGDLVLIKGANSMRLKLILENLMQECGEKSAV